MKKFLLIFAILVSFSPFCLLSQQLKIIKNNSETFNIDVNNLDSVTFKENSFPDIGAPDSVVFPNLDCDDDYIDSNIIIRNSGTKELMITHIKIQPEGAFIFAEEPQHIMNLEPGGEYITTVRFNPMKSGFTYNACLVITSNAKSGVYYSIPLQGRKDSSNFTLSIDSIDLKYVCPNSLNDYILTITNTGDDKISISAKANNLIIKEKLIEIEKGKSAKFLLQAVAGGTEGIKKGEIEFADLCGHTKKASVIWQVAKPLLAAENIKITAQLHKPAEQVLFLKNTGISALIINNIKSNNKNVAVKGITLPATIQAGDSLPVKIVFTPSEAKSLNTSIVFNCSCDYEKIIIVDGTTVVTLIDDDFEWYNEGTFPSSGGWTLESYGKNLDSFQVVSQKQYKSPTKSLKGYGNWGTDSNSTNYHNIRIPVIPEVLFIECQAMIEKVGFSGIGLKSSENYQNIFAELTFGNHAHFYSYIGKGDGATLGMWANLPDYMYEPLKWYKLKIRFDFKNKEMAVYVNDNLKTTISNNNIGVIDNLYFFNYIGGGYGDYSESYIDDVKIWYVAPF